MKHLVSLKLFEGSVLESLASSDTSDIEIRKLGRNENYERGRKKGKYKSKSRG